MTPAIAETQPSQSTDSPPLPGLANCVDRLRELLAEDIAHVALSTAARNLGCSERSLQRHLAASGTSFRRELKQARLRRAQARLLETEMPVLEVARELGFASPESFIREFRKLMGTTPGAWRRARKNGRHDGLANAAPRPAQPQSDPAAHVAIAAMLEGATQRANNDVPRPPGWSPTYAAPSYAATAHSSTPPMAASGWHMAPMREK